MLAQFIYLAQQLVYLVGLCVVCPDCVLVERLAYEILKILSELAKLVAIVLLGNSHIEVCGNADLVNGQTLDLKNFRHTTIVAVMLLDNNAVSHGHDTVSADEIVTNHRGGKGIHEAQRIVKSCFGSLRFAAFADQIRLRADSADPLLGYEVTIILNDFLASMLLPDKLYRAIARLSLKLLQDFFHELRPPQQIFLPFA